MTNAFDTSEKGRNDPCLSESLIRNPNSGVIGYLGCSRSGWGISSTVSLGTSLQYEQKFYENLFSPEFKEKNFGNIVAAAKSSMIPYCKNPTKLWVQYGLNPIGDPETPIFIDTPKVFNNVSIRYTENGVSINSDVDSCRICIMSMGDYGESYYNVFENVEEIIVSDLPEECNICITKQGYIPKQLKACVIQSKQLTGLEKNDFDIIFIGSDITSAKSNNPVIFLNGIYKFNTSEISITPTISIQEPTCSFIIEIGNDEN